MEGEIAAELGRATPMVLQAGEGDVEEGRQSKGGGGGSHWRQDLRQETGRRRPLVVEGGSGWGRGVKVKPNLKKFVTGGINQV
jgi:hypothetical protein